MWISSSCLFQLLYEVSVQVKDTKAKPNNPHTSINKDSNREKLLDEHHHSDDISKERLTLTEDYYSLTWMSFQKNTNNNTILQTGIHTGTCLKH